MQLESLEWRHMLAATFQAEVPILSSNAVYPKSIFAADLDGDKDADVVVASLVDDKVSWYENLDGQGTYSPAKVISDIAVGAASVFVADIDGDGNLDVISGGTSAYDSDVSWYRNEGQGNFGAQQVVSAEVQGTDSVYAADLDGDDDLDILSASRGDGKVAWYENEDGAGSFGQQDIITDTAAGATSVVAADLDGDGDLDVVAASYDDDSIRWWENTGGGNFGGEELLSDTATSVTAVSVADLDSDGDPDIVFTSRDDNTLGWFPNLGTDSGSLEFGPERVISLDDGGPNELYVADLDGDNLLDVAVAGRNGDRVTWHKNLGGGLFDGPRVINDDTDGASAVFAVDADGDGDLDLFSTSRFDNKVAFYRNLDGLGSFSEQQVMSEQGSIDAQFVSSADVDGDGDLDVVAGAYSANTISWFENLDGNGAFGPERVISDRLNGTEAVLIADIDGDGDGDAVSVSIRDNKIAWYANLDGKGDFGIQQVISGDTSGPEYIAVGDIDGDGDTDVLSASRGDNKVAWYPNIDGQGTFGFQVIISLGQAAATFVEVADIDGDGDLDVVANAYDRYEQNQVAWYENVDGEGTFGPENLITTDVLLPTAVDFADFDGDGDLDVVAASGADDRVIWYENENGDGDFAEGRLISDAVDAAYSLKAADFDGDGDADVVVVALLGDSVSWFENEDGQGNFGPEQIISDQLQSPTSVWVADLDGNRLPDVLVTDSQLDQIVWYRNTSEVETPGDFNGDSVVDAEDIDLLCAEIQGDGLDDRFDLTGDGAVNSSDMSELVLNILQTTFGDSNLDGIFNSNDLVLAISAGEYEDDVDDNSTWADGDWNCDGDFTTADLVFALQFGGYVAEASPAANLLAIAAAVDAERPKTAPGGEGS